MMIGRLFAALLLFASCGGEEPLKEGGNAGGTGDLFCGSAQCLNGVVRGNYGLPCVTFTTTCELGCRPDRMFLPIPETNSATEALYNGKRLCEEFRLEHGPRKPGDPCTLDYDCLPYSGYDIQVGTPILGMTCVDGACSRTAHEVADLGTSCTAADPVPGGDLPTFLGRGECESGICYAEGELFEGVCTTPCVDSEQCPLDYVCTAVSVNNDAPPDATASSAQVCVAQPAEAPTPP